MTETRFLDEIVDPSLSDWLLLQKEDGTGIAGKVSVGNLPIAVDTTALQAQINAKANASDVAETVSVLEQSIDGKANVNHAHSLEQIDFSTLPENTSPTVDDFVLLQQLNTGQKQKTRIARLDISSQGYFSWSKISGTSELKVKSFVDTSIEDAVIAVPPILNDGSEFELKKIHSNGSIKLTGINKLDGYVLQSGDILAFDDSQNYATTTRLIYVDPSIGWISYPQSSLLVVKPLNLPTNKLHQLLYSGQISGINNNQPVTTWTDTINAINGTQSSASNKPTYKTKVFSLGMIPGLFFDGNDAFNTNFTWLNNQKYTYCFVEQRLGQLTTYNVVLGVGVGSGGTLIAYQNGASTDTFHFIPHWGKSGTAYSVPKYTSPVTRIWCCSNNNREISLWLNGIKVAVTSLVNADNTTVTTPAYIGLQNGSYYYGHQGLIAGYLGDMSDAEIKAISDAANQTFKVY